MRKTVAILLALLLALPLTALAGETQTVTDGLGREVTIAGTPERLVSLTPANTEILFALGLGDKIVGVDSQSDYPAGALDIANKVGDYSGPNVELIASLESDVVFAGNTLQAETIDQLTSLGITVVCNEPTSYAGIVPGIELIAQVCGVDASALIDQMAAEEQAALESASAAAGARVYFALSFGEYGNWTAAKGTFIDDMITMLGAVNVAAGAGYSWPEYSMEQLLSDDPDLIIVSDYALDGSIQAQLSATDGYSELSCVKAGNVYALDANSSSRPGPRITQALNDMAEILSAYAAAAQDAA